jgi:two-component system, chemotaxis family, chemotaxis protein CheY
MHWGNQRHSALKTLLRPSNSISDTLDFLRFETRKRIPLSFPITERPQPYDLSNFTVLLVEDSLYMQSLISSMLKAFDVGDILVCESGKDAIDLLTITQSRTKSRYVTKVDIVLTDWLMPKGSGRDLLHWIRTHDKDDIRFLPVVVVSGYTTEIIASTSRDMGAHEILVKPISGNLLASRICSVIDHPRPFVKSSNFFGPDRRRQNMPIKGKDRRINIPEIVEAAHL